MKALYEKTDKAMACLDEFYQDDQRWKKTWCNQARRWIAFANGDQNPYPTGSPTMANNQPVNYTNEARQNTYTTNEIEPIIRTLVSYMTRTKPMADCFPDSEEDEQSKNIARTAEVVVKAKYDIDEEQNKSKLAAWWSLVQGTIYRKDYWNPAAGSPIYDVDEQGAQVLDANGNPTQSKHSGGNAVAILTPFSVSTDNSVTDFNQLGHLTESYIMPVEWAREAFDISEPGYTGKAKNIQEDGSFSDTLGMLEDLKFAVPNITSGAGQRLKAKGKVLVRESYIAPGRDMPTGRMIVRAGDTCVYDSAESQDGNPYFMPFEPIMWHPYTKFGYEPYIGRYLDKSLVEQLIPLQMRLNEINGAILENANTMAKPNICAAIKQLKKGILNGKGANVYTYQVIPGAGVPFVMQGTPLPEQFFKEKQMIIDQMVRIAGTNFVMQGQTPTGVTAASAIAQLLENASSQYSDMMQSWEKFHEQGYTKKLRVIHKFHTVPDRNLDKYIKIIDKDALNNQIQDFVGAKDLSDGITLRIQSGSMIPKSQTARSDMFKNWAKEGLFGNVAEDSPRGAKLREQLLERMGETGFDTDEGVELKKAKWENDRIIRNQPVEVSPYDVAAIHLPTHTAKMQDPKFLENADDATKIRMDDHIKGHQQAEQEKVMAAQQEQMQAQMAAQGIALPSIEQAAPPAATPKEIPPEAASGPVPPVQ